MKNRTKFFIIPSILVITTISITVSMIMNSANKEVNVTPKNYSQLNKTNYKQDKEVYYDKLAELIVPNMLGETPNLQTIVKAMDMMSHQKVNVPSDSAGIAMNHHHIELIKDAINNGDIEQSEKKSLTIIVHKWEDSNFTDTVKEHSYFNRILNNKESDAARLRTKDEEINFLLNQVGEDAAREAN